MRISVGKYWLSDIAMIFIAFSLLYLCASYFRPISNPDEGRYAEIPREMIASGDYVTPRLNGLAYFYKPPLFYWLQALSFKTFGISKTSIRLANTIMAVLGLCATYIATRSLYGRKAGWISALVLSSSILYYAIGSMVTLDMCVSVLMASAMFSFIVGVNKSGFIRSILFLSFFVFCAFAVMAKGIIGILIPCTVIFLYSIIGGKKRIHDFFYSMSKADIIAIICGIASFFIIVLPWHIAVSIANPPTVSGLNIFTSDAYGQGFFWYYFIHEHFLRYLDSSTSMRSQPFWFFWVIAPVGFVPWIILIPRAIKSLISSNVNCFNPISFMGVWIAFVVGFFSLSSSKLIPYITVIYPALAFVVGAWSSKEWQNIETKKMRFEQISIIIIGIIASIAIVVAYCILKNKPIDDSTLIAGFYGCIISSSLMLGVSIMAFRYYLKSKMRYFWICAFVGASIFAASININAGMAQKMNSEKIATEIKKLSVENVAIAFNYGAFHDLPVWLDKTLIFIGNPPEEQQFGWQREMHLHSHRILTTAEALCEFLRKNSLVVVLRNEDLPKLQSMSENLLMKKIAGNKNIIVLNLSLNEKK